LAAGFALSAPDRDTRRKSTNIDRSRAGPSGNRDPGVDLSGIRERWPENTNHARLKKSDQQTKVYAGRSKPSSTQIDAGIRETMAATPKPDQEIEDRAHWSEHQNHFLCDKPAARPAEKRRLSKKEKQIGCGRSGSSGMKTEGKKNRAASGDTDRRTGTKPKTHAVNTKNVRS
jgi:hypothetical protein